VVCPLLTTQEGDRYEDEALADGHTARSGICRRRRGRRIPGAPKAIVARLNAEINKVLALPALKEKYATIGYELVGGTPQQFDAFVKSEIAKWAEVVRRSGAKLN